MVQKVVDAVIFSKDYSTIFLQKRCNNRRKFPNTWELPGGHVDIFPSGEETILNAIQRELLEELNLHNVSIDKMLISVDRGDHHYIAVLITVGDMENLKIMEPKKACEYKWATLQDAEELLQDGSGFTSPLLLSVRSAFAFLSYNK
jgi:ADP-ribose pyrophosphatase YjhB (NUDIX family)